VKVRFPIQRRDELDSYLCHLTISIDGVVEEILSVVYHSRKMMKLTLVLAVGACFECAFASPNDARKWAVGQVVQTSSGRIQGHSAGNAPLVSEYLGIPYVCSPDIFRSY
jgi:hypothetical protein